jgi:hypothetical protein
MDPESMPESIAPDSFFRLTPIVFRPISQSPNAENVYLRRKEK